MLDIKKKFLISFGILLLLIGAVGGVMIQQVGKLGRAIDVILRENYQSVLLCQQMNNALERVDSALLYTFTNWDSDVAPVITENIGKRLTPEKYAEESAAIPLGRGATGEEIADAVMFPIRNGYVTGETININGGMYYAP